MLRTILTLIGVGGITSTQLAAGAVGSSALAAGAVTSSALAAGAVDSTALASGAVTSSAIAAGAVGPTQVDGLTASDLDLTGTYNFTTLQVGGIAVATGSLYYAVCRVATTANITNLATSAPNTLDGVSLSSGDDVFVWKQSTNTQNGLYNADTIGTGSNGVWSRLSDRDSAAELPTGLLVYIKEGTSHAQKLFKLTSSVSTIGSDAVVFEEQQEGMTALGSGEPAAVGSGDGSTLNFDLSSSGVVYAAVFVDGLLQAPSVWAIAAGAGAAGVDRLEFVSGNAPGTGASVEAILFIRA